MTIRFSKRFRKQYKKLRQKEQDRFLKQLELLHKDPLSPKLNHHILQGKHAGLHSINVGGDLRALYIKKNHEFIIFALIGTHSQLYG